MEDLFQSVLKVFAELGLWADGVQLIGSWSFLLYQRHLGVRPLPLRTQVPERGRGGLDYRLIKPLGVRAIPLRFLDMLLTDSIKIKESGIDVRVPKPLNFCLHKLIIAQRRTKPEKREKDIQHAVYVLEIVKPDDFNRALGECPPKWGQSARESLRFAYEHFAADRRILDAIGILE